MTLASRCIVRNDTKALLYDAYRVVRSDVKLSLLVFIHNDVKIIDRARMRDRP